MENVAVSINYWTVMTPFSEITHKILELKHIHHIFPVQQSTLNRLGTS